MSSISQLNELLEAYTHAPASDRQAIETDVFARYGQRGAIFVLDMARFSPTSLDCGIVYYLTLVRRMQLIVGPLVEQHDGTIVKFEADNCFAYFATVDQALAASLAIHDALAVANRSTPEDLDIAVAIGIDHGDFLLIESCDFFGNPVNLASKLGEDIGDGGDILLTQGAYDTLTDPSRHHFAVSDHELSGLSLRIHTLQL